MAESTDAASIGDADEEVEEGVAKGLLLEISREIIAAPVSLQNACLHFVPATLTTRTHALCT